MDLTRCFMCALQFSNIERNAMVVQQIALARVGGSVYI